ncbi:SpoIIE family protein phosphatase [Streptomyces sp. NPDC026673]|uniref:SpoIIE family protein phosphatase n=1 Tax=Streptomyces sp. NPDC026673 TaxID=3155724 RepID=UPI00340F76EF
MEPLPTAAGDEPDPRGTDGATAYTATATLDDRGIVTGWSAQAHHLLGHTPDEIIGHPATLLLAEPPRSAPPVSAQRWAGTLALRHRDGHTLHLRLLAHHRPHADEGAGHNGGGARGEGGWLVVAAAPASCDDPPSHDAVRAWAFAQAPCPQAVFDAGLRLTRANTAFEELLGLGEAQMRGLRLPDLAPGDTARQTETQMRNVLGSGRPQHAPAPFTGNGSPAPAASAPQGAVAPGGRGGTAEAAPQGGGGGAAGGAGTRSDADEEHALRATLTPLADAAGTVRGVVLTTHPAAEDPEVRRRSQLLHDAATRIGTTLDTTRTAQELTDLAVPEFADYAAVDLIELPTAPQAAPAAGAVTVTRTAASSILPGTPEALIALGDTATYPPGSPPEQTLTTGKAALYDITDATLARWAAQDPRAAWIREAGTHSVIAIPLTSGGSALGLAVFSRHRNPTPFTADDLALAEKLAHRAATAIHNARRYARERTTTMTLQRSLLPHSLPEQAALDIATRYLPATTHAGVGGDWFDVIPLSGTRVALVVGDVVGHGIRASATMGRLRTAVRTLADVDLPPDELLTHLDDLVIHLCADDDEGHDSDTAGGIGTTCLYAVYDPTTRQCSLARAGHPPPAVVTPDHAVHFLDVPAGPPLGLGGLPFETMTTNLPEGTVLALYTNGLLDPHHHDIDQSLDKMFTALAHPAQSLDAVCDRVLTTLITHRPTDDIALLVARTRTLPSDHIATWQLPNDPATVAQARHHTTTQLTAWGLEETAFTTELLVSELVTNAIRYGKPPIRLRLIHNTTALIIEVTDTSNTTPHLRRARTYDEGGRGLLLVAQLAQQWGTRHHPRGKTIWTEQALTPV